MRIAVVYLPVKDRERIHGFAESMTRALAAKGHMVDLSEARPDETPRLTGYDYVVVGTESSSLFGKISDKIPKFLAQAGTLTGKRSMAFVRKSGLRSEKALARLMRAMEAEGMVVNCAEIIGNDDEAARAAREAPVERY
jgi:menaquinone-dependent protoporphyrinogen IX oxidase